MTTPHLQIDQVEVRYGNTVALHPFSLAVNAREFFCLLGPSGCGKTTTLNLIAGFTDVATGRVLINGRDVTYDTPQEREIGVVFQSYALFPNMTVAENIGYGLKLRKVPKGQINQRVEELVDLIHLTGKEQRYPKQLSGGEQQRVAIARALAIRPALLLLDEPLSNLDARLREEMRTELKRIQRAAGVTTLLVTHDQDEAFGIADRVAVMNAGRIEQIGTPAEIYCRPTSNFVEKFIGRSNNLQGTESNGVIRIKNHNFSSALSRSANSIPCAFRLRPEEITIDAQAGGRNSIDGRIAEVTFTGAIQNVMLTTDIGNLLVSRLSADQREFRVGEAVTASWSPQAGALLNETVS